MKYLALAFLAASALVACGTTETETNPATTTTGTSTATGLAQTPLSSDWGGFIKQTKIDPPTPDPVTYCDAERLLWAYDAETGSLGLTDARMLLNCCGEHSVEVTLDNGTYVVAERDAPQIVDGTEARCGCMCVFDFGVSVEGIPSGVLPIRVTLDVTDSAEGVKVVYEGSLDLAAGSGTVTLDAANVEPWCSGATP